MVSLILLTLLVQAVSGSSVCFVLGIVFLWLFVSLLEC